METNTKFDKLSVPMAIIVAGVLIAGAVYFSSIKSNDTDSKKENEQKKETVGLDNIKEINKTDHIRGNPDAIIKIVEYSDTECPFCKNFQNSMKQIMNEYGADGKVAWIYRHSPIDSLHPKSRKEATATECANELGGNDKFWEYLDRVYEITPSNNKLDLAELPKIAEEIGLNVTEFNTCLNSGKYDERIEENLQNAIATGGGGTPWSVVITQDGKKYSINGAQPYEVIKQLIDLKLE